MGGWKELTDYVFHFHFALCLNKQFLTALFSKPTFSQLLPGASEKESDAQTLQELFDFTHSLHLALSVWIHKPWGALPGGSNGLAEAGRLQLQSNSSRAQSEPRPRRGHRGNPPFAELLCQLGCHGTNLLPPSQPRCTPAWKRALNPYNIIKGSTETLTQRRSKKLCYSWAHLMFLCFSLSERSKILIIKDLSHPSAFSCWSRITFLPSSPFLLHGLVLFRLHISQSSLPTQEMWQRC